MNTSLNTKTASVNALLCAASDRLSAIAQEHRPSRANAEAAMTARLAADFLYEVAERLARGETAAPGERTPAMELAQRGAVAKLAELQWKHGVQIVPDAAQWKGFDWSADMFGRKAKTAHGA